MLVAVYARVSTDGQNVDIQVQELRRYCQSRRWEIAFEITDTGYSGKTDRRPGLKKLLQLVRSRKVDAVLTLKLDRLFRSLKHLVTILEDWHELEVKFVALRDNVDWSTPSGRMFTQLLAVLGEFEAALARERTLLGLAHARKKGKVLGRPKKRPDDTIRKLRSQGLSYLQIQRKLGISKGAVCRALSTPKTPTSLTDADAVISGSYDD